MRWCQRSKLALSVRSADATGAGAQDYGANSLACEGWVLVCDDEMNPVPMCMMVRRGPDFSCLGAHSASVRLLGSREDLGNHHGEGTANSDSSAFPPADSGGSLQARGEGNYRPTSNAMGRLVAGQKRQRRHATAWAHSRVFRGGGAGSGWVFRGDDHARSTGDR